MSSEVLEALRPLWEQFGVERAWLFGGRVRGKVGADSDWDGMGAASRRGRKD